MGCHTLDISDHETTPKKGATRGALFLTHLMLRLLSSNAQECKKYDNHPNQVMWVFIEKLSLSTSDEYPYTKVSVISQLFCHNCMLIK